MSGGEAIELIKRNEVQATLEWLEHELPSLHSSLAGPASVADIEALEQRAGRLPDSFRAFYERHDGQLGEDVHFVPYFYLASLAEIAATIDEHKCYEEIGWRDGWVPFARSDCDYLCLDLSDAAGTRGEVFEFLLKFESRPVVARSFSEFLGKLRYSIDSGPFVVTDRGVRQAPNQEQAWSALWADQQD